MEKELSKLNCTMPPVAFWNEFIILAHLQKKENDCSAPNSPNTLLCGLQTCPYEHMVSEKADMEIESSKLDCTLPPVAFCDAFIIHAHLQKKESDFSAPNSPNTLLCGLQTCPYEHMVSEKADMKIESSKLN